MSAGKLPIAQTYLLSAIITAGVLTEFSYLISSLIGKLGQNDIRIQLPWTAFSAAWTE